MEVQNQNQHFFKHANFLKHFPLLATSVVDVINNLRKEWKSYQWKYEIVFDTFIENYYNEIDSVADPYWK